MNISRGSLLALLFLILISAGASALVLAPVASSQASASTSTISTNVAKVSIVSGAQNPNNGLFYSPANITVVLGVNNTVIWTNHDSTNHTVVALDNSYAATLAPGQSFTHTFTSPGVYDYHCTIHNWMKGSVIVLAAPSSSTTTPSSTSTSSTSAAVPEFPFTAIAVFVITALVVASYIAIRQTRRG